MTDLRPLGPRNRKEQQRIALAVQSWVLALEVEEEEASSQPRYWQQHHYQRCMVEEGQRFPY